VPLQTEKFGRSIPNTVPTIIKLFKSTVTKQINIIRGTPAQKFWQRNYYEHIIRNDDELNQIQEYIIHNPQKWELDKENPEHWNHQT
jgi:putative transposase